MLFKLLKYDFRAMWKQFSLVWGAALVLALVNRFTLFRNIGHDAFTNSSLLTLAFMGVVIAMIVLSISFVADRFSKGLLGSEGYLMHTLPVRSWQLVASKLICGAVTWMISGAVAFVSPFLMAPMDWSILMEFGFWRDIMRGLTQRPDTLLLLFEFCLMVVAVMLQFIASIYLALSIGHLLPRYRRLGSVAAFIGLYILLANLYSRVFSAHVVRALLDVTTSNVYGSLLTATATLLIPAALFLAAVCWILDHKLNLE